MTNIYKYVKAVLIILWSLFTGIIFRLYEILGQFAPSNSWGCRIRGIMYKPFLKSCGKNLQVGLHAKLEHLGNIQVGDDVYIGHGCWISGLRGGIFLRDEVMLGPYVTMVSSNHRFMSGSARFAPGIGGNITVGKGTWIASGATVTAGVEIGQSCLIAAGCVVTKYVKDHSIIGGVPGRIIGNTKAES